jgi:small subunit ribosomal protein S18
MSEEIKNTDTTAAFGAVDSTDSVVEPAQTTYGKKTYTSQDESGGLYQRNVRFKINLCRFCNDKNAQIDYKDVKMVEQFITDRGKILPRRVTGICAKHQRGVALAIKRARIIALIPFFEK